ncbi:MAG: DNA cytosine methyltransferase [Solibacillus sp.]
MKLGSLFDGSGGFPLAGTMCGITPAWASEIEPFPVAVTTNRFPNMKHLGDITNINGAEIEPVDIITFGSPCQGLSVAGLQKGLGDERSCLFLEAIRIIKEMRTATNGKYPTYAVWENVPGAFSSNKGEDFRTVLKEFCKIKAPNMSMPIPNKRKSGGLEWRNAGGIVGNGYSLAWRVLNAQFWGVPQRRKRIFLVADFAGERAGKILFERQGLSRNFTQSENEGQGAATITKNGVIGASGNAIEYSFNSLSSNSMKSKNPHSGCNVVEIAKCLDTTYPCPSKNQGGIAIVQSVATGIDAYNLTTSGDVAATLTANSGISATHSGPMVIYDARGNGTGDICPTITGDHNGHISDYTAICIAGNTIDRKPQNGGNGGGSQEDISYTLNTVDRHAVCFEQQAYDKYTETDISANSKACGGNHGGGSETLVCESKYRYIIRRLTPLECCRLQGFPDWWCSDIPHSDSAEYKMWGNGVALPCVLYVLEGIANELKEGEQ